MVSVAYRPSRVPKRRSVAWDDVNPLRGVTGMLVLFASSRLLFAWFDESLEHYDPRARRASPRSQERLDQLVLSSCLLRRMNMRLLGSSQPTSRDQTSAKSPSFSTST